MIRPTWCIGRDHQGPMEVSAGSSSRNVLSRFIIMLAFFLHYITRGNLITFAIVEFVQPQLQCLDLAGPEQLVGAANADGSQLLGR